MTRSFKLDHPYRIDLADGFHVRFSTLAGAADSALWFGLEIFCEHSGKTIDPRSAYAASL